MSTIHRNMQCSQDPLANTDARKWRCPSLDRFPNRAKFNALFDTNSLKLIANSGQSKVYWIKAKHETKDAGYVLKCYSLPEASNKRHKQRLQRIWTEFMFIRQTKLLWYGGIFYDHKNQDMIILSEPLQYSLSYYVQSKHKTCNISEAECKLITLQILDKLHTVHQANFIHNDLKPDNLMYGENTECAEENGWRLIDFGSIMRADECTAKRSAYIGTRSWTAPELDVHSTCNRYSWQADIWSLGLVVLYILFKTQPYLLSADECRYFGGDTQKKLDYFYLHKLMRFPFAEEMQKTHENRKIFSLSKYVPCCMRTRVCSTASTWKHGAAFLNTYLKDLREVKKISSELFDLLSSHMLQFDPAKRSDCATIYKHKWFDQVRHL